MKTLKDYLVESEQWHESPAAGDNIGIELDDGTLIETWIMEATEDSLLVDATPEIVTVLEQWATLSDVLLENISVDEQGQETEGTATMTKIAAAGDNGYDMIQDGLDGLLGTEAQIILQDMYDDVSRSNRLNPDDDYEQIVDRMMDHIETDYGQAGIAEAEYQGRNVPLGKPMRGDVKKFKVYVRDPKSGNVKKVNFGHGGTSARRAGQKTMKIRKSDPARRRSFRARHNCDNPGPRTKARYWSCRKW